ncbi:PREDICTED: uncharacterized protein LOC109591005 isoform X2 [Amphimedon queenslandica]|uniref:IgGFc-binding protein N-terminal domain-containing protein n=2 Tax=Amphimedon queenslandica TaxID=400682 RepID=A0AAN0JZG2_AMPQE|nr:PREDICTED: uncharacterized protein LOC109591005 isoform X2 [Amphimedon queenslandica]|eukprot:XP_019862381.1 PREDICTED: uncharacterized protein LOC109591005 isoform X2 [Amphimedon queenslandica]
MSACHLLVILLCFMSNGIFLEANGESCTEGFMDYSLLQGKAATPHGYLRNNRLSNYNNTVVDVATRWIIIEDNIKFTCATVITEILIGVDIRTIDGIRNLYPRFEVWAPTNDNDVYTREMSVEIRLTPDNFTTNGQYRFTLPTPLNVSSGYRIGVYQPPGDRSVVRFHYINLPGMIDKDRTGKVQTNLINNSDIKISGGGRQVDHEEVTILIHPIVQNTSCFPQFVPDDVINSLSYSITDSYYVSDTRIFPDIRFTCHGIITNWIVYAPAQVSVIKIRHSNNLTTTATTLNTSASNAVRITSLLYNFTMSNEITVQPGDILMIESNSTNLMFYHQYNGPHNYRLGDNNELIALDTNDYPLISVVVEPFTNTATSTISSTHINTVITVLPSSSIYSTATVTVESMEYTKTNSISSNSLSLTIGTTSMMSTPVSTLQSTDSNTLILVGSISTVFILLVVTILVILIVSVLVCRRLWYKTTNRNDTFRSTEREADINQQSDAPNMEKSLLASTNPAYGVTGENCNTDVSANPAYGITEKSGVSANPAYGITGAIESIDEEALVYDEPRTMMYNKQEVTITQNEAYGQL